MISTSMGGSSMGSTQRVLPENAGFAEPNSVWPSHLRMDGVSPCLCSRHSPRAWQYSRVACMPESMADHMVDSGIKRAVRGGMPILVCASRARRPLIGTKLQHGVRAPTCKPPEHSLQLRLQRHETPIAVSRMLAGASAALNEGPRIEDEDQTLGDRASRLVLFKRQASHHNTVD